MGGSEWHCVVEGGGRIKIIDGTWCYLSLWMKKLKQDWVLMTPNDLGAEMGGDEY